MTRSTEAESRGRDVLACELRLHREPMAEKSRSDDLPQQHQAASRRRTRWRQTLVDAERGLALGFRQDSSLYAILFVAALVAVTGLALQLAWWGWIGLVACLTVVLVTELLHQALAGIAGQLNDDPLSDPFHRAIKISRGAVIVAIVGVSVISAAILGHRINSLFPIKDAANDGTEVSIHSNLVPGNPWKHLVGVTQQSSHSGAAVLRPNAVQRTAEVRRS